MREALKRLTGESLVYGLGQAGGRAVQLLLVPVLTRALAPQAYGVADSILAYSQLALLVLVMGMDAALARFFYQQPDTDARRTMIGSSLALRIVAGLAFSALAFAAAGPLSQPLLGSPAYAKYLRVAALTLPATLLLLFTNDVLRVTFQPWKFITVNLLNVLITAGFSIHFVIGMKVGVIGVLYGKLLGDALVLPLAALLLRHSIAPRVDSAILKRMLRYGAPTIVGALAYGVLGSADRWFLVQTRGLGEVGVYAVAAKFFSGMMLLVSAFQLAFGPFAFARAQDPGAPRLYARILGLYTACGSLGALALALAAPEIVALLAPPAYAGAALPAALLGFAAAAYGAYYVAALGATLALRTDAVAWTSVVAAVVGLAAHAVLTPRFGPGGAAAATLLGYATSALSLYRVSQRLHPLPYRGTRALAMFVVALGAALVGVTAAKAGGGAAWAARAGLWLLGAGVSVALGLWWNRGSIREEHSGSAAGQA
jgi:O-antigen/teichoic acid export membrane protein